MENLGQIPKKTSYKCKKINWSQVPLWLVLHFIANQSNKFRIQTPPNIWTKQPTQFLEFLNCNASELLNLQIIFYICIIYNKTLNEHYFLNVNKRFYFKNQKIT